MKDWTSFSGPCPKYLARFECHGGVSADVRITFRLRLDLRARHSLLNDGTLGTSEVLIPRIEGEGVESNAARYVIRRAVGLNSAHNVSLRTTST